VNYDGIMLGPLQECNRKAFLDSILDLCRPGKEFWLAEIGIAAGATMAGILRALQRHRPDCDWKCAGIDIVGGWCFHSGAIRSSCGQWLEPAPKLEDLPELPARKLVYYDCGSEYFFNHAAGIQFDAVHVDGCHAPTCVARDFLVAAPKLKVGGVMIFHDADPWCQNDPKEIQGCGFPIGTRQALISLDILGVPHVTGYRKGWAVEHNIIPSNAACATHNRGGQLCRGSVIIRKTAEAP